MTFVPYFKCVFDVLLHFLYIGFLAFGGRFLNPIILSYEVVKTFILYSTCY